eukprot:jgi/Mesen1/2143/ME000152S01228
MGKGQDGHATGVHTDRVVHPELLFKELADLICPFCSDLVHPDHAQHATCGHVFCSHCVSEALPALDNKCPMDDEAVSASDLQPLQASMPDMYQLLFSTKVKCVKHTDGCLWEGELSALAAHEAGCSGAIHCQCCAESRRHLKEAEEKLACSQKRMAVVEQRLVKSETTLATYFIELGAYKRKLAGHEKAAAQATAQQETAGGGCGSEVAAAAVAAGAGGEAAGNARVLELEAKTAQLEGALAALEEKLAAAAAEKLQQEEAYAAEIRRLVEHSGKLDKIVAGHEELERMSVRKLRVYRETIQGNRDAIASLKEELAALTHVVGSYQESASLNLSPGEAKHALVMPRNSSAGSFESMSMSVGSGKSGGGLKSPAPQKEQPSPSSNPSSAEISPDDSPKCVLETRGRSLSQPKPIPAPKESQPHHSKSMSISKGGGSQNGSSILGSSAGGGTPRTFSLTDSGRLVDYWSPTSSAGSSPVSDRNVKYISRGGKGGSGRQQGKEAGSCASTLSGHKDYVKALVLSPDGTLWSGSADKCIKGWRDGLCVQTMHGQSAMSRRSSDGHRDAIYCLAIAPDGSLLYSGSQDKTIKCWLNGDCVANLQGHTATVSKLAVSSDGALWSGSHDKTIKKWVSFACAATLVGHTDIVLALTVGPDDSLWSGSADKTIRQWRDGVCVATLTGHRGAVFALAVAPGGTLWSGSQDLTVKAWRGGACVATLEGHTHWVMSIAASPDGTIWSSAKDQTIKGWRDGACVMSLKGHSNWVEALVVASNGTVWSGSWDKTIKGWLV